MRVLTVLLHFVILVAKPCGGKTLSKCREMVIFVLAIPLCSYRTEFYQVSSYFVTFCIYEMRVLMVFLHFEVKPRSGKTLSK